MVNLAQYSIEQFLLDAAEKKSELIDIRWNTKVTAFDALDRGTRSRAAEHMAVRAHESDPGCAPYMRNSRSVWALCGAPHKAHARRRFYEIDKAHKTPGLAREALRFIG